MMDILKESYIYVYETQCAYDYIDYFYNQDVESHPDKYLFPEKNEDLINILKLSRLGYDESQLTNIWSLPLDKKVYCYKARLKFEDYIIISPIELNYFEDFPMCFNKIILKKSEKIFIIEDAGKKMV